MTGKEIIETLKASGISVSEFAYEEYDSRKLNLGESKEVDQYGGEGQGDTWYSIKYFKDHNVYLKVSGWYTSYYGTHFDGWDNAVREVVPKEKTITVYE